MGLSISFAWAESRALTSNVVQMQTTNAQLYCVIPIFCIWEKTTLSEVEIITLFYLKKYLKPVERSKSRSSTF